MSVHMPLISGMPHIKAIACFLRADRHSGDYGAKLAFLECGHGAAIVRQNTIERQWEIEHRKIYLSSEVCAF
ncbi:hypothetical protein SCA6_013131 [Theobroma cacao]